jgi:hypothetical protein
MSLLRNSVLGALVLAAVALTPKAVLADEGVPIDGTFAVSFMRPAAPSAVTGPYCASGGTPIEAQGIGSVSKVGPLFLTVKKCLTFPVAFPAGVYTGTFKMTAGNGDTLEGTYEGTQDFSLKDENGYGPFQGTLTFTGGTGSFRHARGVLSFTAVTSPVSASVTPTGVPSGSPANGMAYYLVRGTMSHEKH